MKTTSPKIHWVSTMYYAQERGEWILGWPCHPSWPRTISVLALECPVLWGTSQFPYGHPLSDKLVFNYKDILNSFKIPFILIFFYPSAPTNR